MPSLDSITIDPELFQLITLGALAILFLLLLLTLMRLGRLRRGLDRMGDQIDSHGHALQDMGSRVSSGLPVSGGSGIPGVEVATAPALHAAALSGGTSAGSQDPSAGAGWQASAAQPEPGAQQSQEPFERDGRWWAYRGDELLVYDEATGQWVPGDRGSQAAFAGASGPYETGDEGGGASSGATMVGGAAAALSGTERTTESSTGSFSLDDAPGAGSHSGSGGTGDDQPGTETAAGPAQSAGSAGLTQESAWPQRLADEPSASDAGAGTSGSPERSQEPFERDGRWWAYRGDELLVYDEGSGEWTPAPAGAGPQAAEAAPAAAEAPESSEPYEKDGRWWFRRGGELLVYDDAAGQWVPAGEGAPDASGGAGGGTATFWKCASCGAVNGSTATSCRMCFAPRP